MTSIELITHKKCTGCRKLEPLDSFYDKHFSALDFHHIDPTTKETTVHKLLNTGTPTPEKIVAMRHEIDKCVVLCSNCHRIEHSKYDLLDMVDNIEKVLK